MRKLKKVMRKTIIFVVFSFTFLFIGCKGTQNKAGSSASMNVNSDNNNQTIARAEQPATDQITKEVPSEPMIQPSTTVKQPNSKVNRLADFILDPANREKFVSFVRKQSDAGYMHTQAVFVVGKTKYTVWFPDDRSPISFWARPNGTSSKALIETWSDENMDDIVDLGLTGSNNPNATNAERKIFLPFDGDKSDYSFAKYWQKKHDDAMRDIFRHFKLS